MITKAIALVLFSSHDLKPIKCTTGMIKPPKCFKIINASNNNKSHYFKQYIHNKTLGSHQPGPQTYAIQGRNYHISSRLFNIINASNDTIHCIRPCKQMTEIITTSKLLKITSADNDNTNCTIKLLTQDAIQGNLTLTT